MNYIDRRLGWLAITLLFSGPIGCRAAQKSIGPSVNLLTVNPSFETPGNFGGGHGTSNSVSGWEIDYFSYDSFWIADGDVTLGKRALNLNHGGRVTTAKTDRATVQPGIVYQMRFDAKKTVENDPGALAGFTPSLLFYDAQGTLIKEVKTLDVQAGGGPTQWQRFTVTATAPAGAVKAGVQVILSRGGWPHEDQRTGLVDNFELVALLETRDTVQIRRAPLLIERGKSANLKVKYTAKGTRDVVVRLIVGATTIGGMRTTVTPGRGMVEWSVTVPANAPESEHYQWIIKILPHGGTWNKSLDTQLVAGVFLSEKMLGSGMISADSTNILYAGRWNRADPKNPIMYWGGSQILTRFAGTSVTAKIATPDGEEYLGVIDGDVDDMVKARVQGGQLVIAKGLPNGNHTLMLMKNTEAYAPAVFQGFVLDPGKGLLRPEPLSKRRIEFYGDSITSGGIPDPIKPNPDPNTDGDYSNNFARTYAAYTARELGADWRPISKGGTGISGSFVVNYTLLDYWDRWDFEGWHPQSDRAWDFSQWQPDVVVIAIGQNDLFRKPSEEAFDTNYASFIQKLHTVYPKAQIFCTNTSMSGFAGGSMWERAILPLLDKYPYLHFQLFLPGNNHGGHPRLEDHKGMALGTTEWNSLADWIGDTMGW